MAERSGVFVLQPDDSLIPMEPAQFATEDDFQRLLARFPALLVGDQIDQSAPRRWILVRREQPIATDAIGASQWSVDHLFLDQDGIPTLVEIKRQSDSRIRREVVGQMLDYAANCATYWSAETLRAGFEKTCTLQGRASDAVLAELMNPEQTADEFWALVKTNLQAGKIRMLFVADKIPVELRRIVEFLNLQMDPAEVLAIELRQFAGEGLKTLVPMVYGQTQEASARKNASVGQPWDEQRIFERLEQNAGSKEVEIARLIFGWMQENGRRVIYGTGLTSGSVRADLRPGGIRINPLYLSTEGEGKIYLPFSALEGKPVFGDIAKRREFMNRLNVIDGISLVEADLKRWPWISLSSVAKDPKGPEKIQSALRWLDEELAAYSPK
jgi:hypothetical protein